VAWVCSIINSWRDIQDMKCQEGSTIHLAHSFTPWHVSLLWGILFSQTAVVPMPRHGRRRGERDHSHCCVRMAVRSACLWVLWAYLLCALQLPAFPFRPSPYNLPWRDYSFIASSPLLPVLPFFTYAFLPL